MAKITSFGEIGPHHPIYGIDGANVAGALTRKNWTSKALWRRHLMGDLYIFIEKGTAEDETAEGGDQYFVRVWVVARGDLPDFRRTFPTLTDALEWVNCERESPIGRETEPAPLETLPEHKPELLVSFPKTRGV